MSRSPILVVVLGLAALLGGCVGISTVNVGYEEARAARGPLSAAGPRRILIEVTDRRPMASPLIGYKRAPGTERTLASEFLPPSNARSIAVTRPVREIVHDALAVELRKNNHAVVRAEADRVLAVDVQEFWLDVQEGFWSNRFSATMAITMTVADARTGRVLLTRNYQGHAVKSGQGMMREGNWKTPMNSALEGMMREVATDPRLVEALRTP
jgi:YajG family uncharacterized lipoprotein